MIAIVCGGRDYNNLPKVAEVLEKLWPEYIIHGGAKGADMIADLVCKQLGIHTLRADALWDAHKKGAGPRRNQFMLDLGLADTLIAFPGGRGTADMISKSRKAMLEIIEVEDD